MVWRPGVEARQVVPGTVDAVPFGAVDVEVGVAFAENHLPAGSVGAQTQSWS